MPSAFSPASTSAADARRSLAITGAPRRLSTPSITAVAPSKRTLAPIRLSSATCIYRCGKIFSVTELVPLFVESNAHICACMSVGQHGNGIACDIHGVTARCERIGNRTHVLRLRAFYRHSVSGNCTCYQKRACFNSIRNNAVLHAVQLTHAFDDDSVRPGTSDLCTHSVE